ncbi:glycosyltransferase family 2 protein [Candidatus Daviesbacteria bacterium]|nr:glycosyltransferase family 2 protein [Candidatus Daviesbacteria bacterium]
MRKLAVVIVNYKAGDILQDCLEALVRPQTNLDMEIWVVDNASGDGSPAMIKKKFAQVKLIENSSNLGYAKANNIALKQIDAEYVLLLNPDCVVDENTIFFMLGFMDKYPKVGASTCLVVLADGQIDWACHRGFPSPWAALTYFFGLERQFPRAKLLSQYHQTYKNLNEIHEIDSPSGAFFLIRKQVIDQVGFLDEDYFMYGEDIDWSFRVKQAGWRIMYIPEVKATHYKGISSGIKQHSQEQSTADDETKVRSTKAFYEAMKIFYRKHYHSRYFFLVNWLVYLAIDYKLKKALSEIRN